MKLNRQHRADKACHLTPRADDTRHMTEQQPYVRVKVVSACYLNAVLMLQRLTELRSCVNVELDVLGSPSLIVRSLWT